MSTRQTASFLRRRFETAGIRPDIRHGQNFLIDLNLLQLLAEAAQVQANEVVLEVGTGLGSLTAILAQRAAGVVTVEIDSRLQQLAAEQLLDYGNITMLRQDALRNKNNLDPRVMEAVRQSLQATGAERFKLAANLPYNIATPVLSNLLSEEPLPASMTVTIQKELADRITAAPGSRDYSALSVWIQSQCDAAVIRVLPPSAFWPRPKVHSAILHIVPNREKRQRIADREFFHAFLRDLFAHRRKILRGGLVSAYSRRLEKSEIDKLLTTVGINPQSRAEELDIATLLELCQAVQQQLGHASGR